MPGNHDGITFFNLLNIPYVDQRVKGLVESARSTLVDLIPVLSNTTCLPIVDKKIDPGRPGDANRAQPIGGITWTPLESGPLLEYCDILKEGQMGKRGRKNLYLEGK